MNLYLIERISKHDYDEYDSAVVAANNAIDARYMNPRNGEPITEWPCSMWALSAEDVTVQQIGIAPTGTKTGVICASYNAG